MKTPYFRATYDGHAVRVRGHLHCRMGHEIHRGVGQKPDGVFAEWHWDGNALNVRNDRLGFYPLYYYQKDGQIGVSPSIAKLIREGAPADLDYDALSVFLRYGNFIGEDTPFESIRAVPPDARFRWEKGRLECAGKYAFSDRRDYSRKQSIDAFIALFRQSIRRRSPEKQKFVIPLSGGKDSRFILFELLNQGRTPTFCLTVNHYPPRPNEDGRIASRLAAELSLKHEIIAQPKSRFHAELKKNELTDFCADEHAWLLPVSERLTGKFDIVYDGIGGDMLSDVDGDGRCSVEVSHLFESNKLDAVADKIIRRSERTIKRLVHPDHYGRMGLEGAKAHLVKELKKHAQVPNPVGSYYFWNRTRRKISLSPYRLLQGVKTVYSPFLDHDLTEFLSSLPWRFLCTTNLRTEAILAAYPQFAHIPFENRGVGWSYSTQDAREHFSSFARDILGYVLRKKNGSSTLVNTAYVVPTLASGTMSNYAISRYAWLYEITLYLCQLGFEQTRLTCES